jgi:hypothetical protein
MARRRPGVGTHVDPSPPASRTTTRLPASTRRAASGAGADNDVAAHLRRRLDPLRSERFQKVDQRPLVVIAQGSFAGHQAVPK